MEKQFVLGIFIGLLFLLAIITAISHAPIFQLKYKDKQDIISNGVIHFTSPQKAKKILAEQTLKGYPSAFEKFLGPLIWTYKYEDDIKTEKKHDYLLTKKRGKDSPENYSVCLIITELDDFTISKARTRHGFFRDKPIVFRIDNISPTKIEIKKYW